MRARFLAAAGPEQRLRKLIEARGWERSLPAGWTILLRLRELLILARTDGPSLLFPNGAVLGTLFDGTDPVRQPTPRLNEAVEAGRGQILIDDHWGAWFAVFADKGGHWALRDPSAFAPAYYRTEEGVSLYYSDLEAAGELAPRDQAVDLEFLRHWVTFPHLRTARTGLEGTSELLPGTRRAVVGRSVTLSTAWDPWSFASADRQIMDFDDAAEHLRDEAIRVIPALARGRGRLLLELSGGLDSSVIAASLKAGGLPFMTVNFVTRTAEGDERRYARAVADMASEQHFEIAERDAILDLALPDRQRLRPGLSPVMAPLHRQFADHGRKVGAETFLTGAGGDNVFCFLTTAAPILDAWRALGPRQALGTVLPDLSEMCGCTAWTAAGFALRKAARQLRRPPPWKRDLDFLMRDAAPAAPESHPWLDRFPGAPAGKREHVTALLRIQHVIDPETRIAGLAFVHPLIAQPLMELCLRVPPWLWVRGGRNRAVARHAFRGLLPDEVLARRGKGGLEGLCMRAWRRHKSDIAELLLGGFLREAGLLDPDPLEAYLEFKGPPPDARYFRIFELITAELWLRSWRR